MGRKAGALICVLMLTAVLSGCRFIRIEEGERTPLDYTVMKQEEIPQEVVELMEQKKEKDFYMTYQVGDVRYLMKGYGEQLSGGYSIQVTDLSVSSSAVFFCTKLVGPDEENVGGEPSYPYIVVKTGYRDVPVEFQ